MSVNSALGFIIIIAVVVWLLVYSGGLKGSYTISGAVSPVGGTT